MLEVKLSIGDLARRAGVRPSALRYYESVGLLTPPKRINSSRNLICELPVAMIAAADPWAAILSRKYPSVMRATSCDKSAWLA